MVEQTYQEKVIERHYKQQLKVQSHMAKNSESFPEFKLQHPAEARAGAKGDYTELKKRLNDEKAKHIERMSKKREKRYGISTQ